MAEPERLPFRLPITKPPFVGEFGSGEGTMTRGGVGPAGSPAWEWPAELGLAAPNIGRRTDLGSPLYAIPTNPLAGPQPQFLASLLQPGREVYQCGFAPSDKETCYREACPQSPLLSPHLSELSATTGMKGGSEASKGRFESHHLKLLATA